MISGGDVIGQANASIYAAGSDGSSNVITIANMNLQAVNYGIYMSGVGTPQISNNAIVMTTANSYGIRWVAGNNGYTYGAIYGNTVWGLSGGVTAVSLIGTNHIAQWGNQVAT
jgi:Na+-translocating ferredoxin:NAD+ oxidoreductase RnfE subunit